jgi:putative transcriptional regulator
MKKPFIIDPVTHSWFSTLRTKPPMFTGTDVVKLRYKYGMTQEKFAEALNAPRSTLTSWESGAKKPSGPARRLLQLFEANAP